MNENVDSRHDREEPHMVGIRFATLNPVDARRFLDHPKAIDMPDEAKDLLVDLVKAEAIRIPDPDFHPSMEIIPERPLTADERETLQKISVLIRQKPNMAGVTNAEDADR